MVRLDRTIALSLRVAPPVARSKPEHDVLRPPDTTTQPPRNARRTRQSSRITLLLHEDPGA